MKQAGLACLVLTYYLLCLHRLRYLRSKATKRREDDPRGGVAAAAAAAYKPCPGRYYVDRTPIYLVCYQDRI